MGVTATRGSTDGATTCTGVLTTRFAGAVGVTIGVVGAVFFGAHFE